MIELQTAGSAETFPTAVADREPRIRLAAETVGIHVCHVSMCLSTGGLERLLVDFARFHDRREFRMQFVALDELGPPADDIRHAGCEAFSVRNDNAGKLRRVLDLARLFRDRQFDIVHTHNTYAHFYGALAAKLAGVPAVINTQHGRGCGAGWKARLQFRIANRFARQVIGVSSDAARLCSREDLWSAHKTTYIWNGIDLKRFVYRGPVLRPVAISVARLSPEKDYSTLLRAVSAVVREVPDFELRLVGDGSERPALERQVDELHLRRHVTFLGERSDVPALLAEAGFFVSSSRTEGISLTLLEAMAVGLPIVTTAVGGNPEVVEAGVTGRLVPPCNPDALAAAIIDMCRRPQTWPAMGEQARRRVEQHFEIRQMVRDYENLYRQLL